MGLARGENQFLIWSLGLDWITSHWIVGNFVYKYGRDLPASRVIFVVVLV